MTVAPFGPHHSFKRCGSVKAFHTKSRGASKTRLMTNSCRLFPSATSFLPGLNFLQISVEPIEALFPKPAVVLDPVRRVFQRARLQPRRAPLRFAAARNQAGALQYLQVLRHGGSADVERLCQFGDGSFAQGEPCEDGAPRRVGEGRERRAKAIGRHK